MSTRSGSGSRSPSRPSPCAGGARRDRSRPRRRSAWRARRPRSAAGRSRGRRRWPSGRCASRRLELRIRAARSGRRRRCQWRPRCSGATRSSSSGISPARARCSAEFASSPQAISSAGNPVQRKRGCVPIGRLLRRGPFSGKLAGARSGTRRLLEDSVRSRMLADVPLGVFLSGRVDSTLIAALAALNSSGPIKTFTVGYDVGTANETHAARAVAEALGADHQRGSLFYR